MEARRAHPAGAEFLVRKDGEIHSSFYVDLFDRTTRPFTKSVADRLRDTQYTWFLEDPEEHRGTRESLPKWEAVVNTARSDAGGPYQMR